MHVPLLARKPPDSVRRSRGVSRGRRKAYPGPSLPRKPAVSNCSSWIEVRANSPVCLLCIFGSSLSVQVLDDDTLNLRKQAAQRFPRRIETFSNLTDVILNVKDEKFVRRTLDVHFERLQALHNAFNSNVVGG